MLANLINYPYGGARFTEFTLSKMRDFVQSYQHRAEIVRAARMMVQDCPPKDYYCEAEKIFQWVKGNIRYTRDPQNAEWVQAPDVTLREGFADCDDFSTLLGALWGAIGLPSGFEAVMADAAHPGEYSHVYGIVKTPRGWRAADPTVPESEFGWRPTRGIQGRKIVLNQ